MKTEIMPDEWASCAPGDRLVLVYGTLRKGGCNDINRLTPAPVFRGMATVLGRLFDLGPYPGLLLARTPEEGGGVVCGEVYAIDAALEPQLDVIEEIQGLPDDEYFRRRISVNVGGRACSCLVYEVNPQRAQGYPLIDHGDWIKHVGRART